MALKSHEREFARQSRGAATSRLYNNTGHENSETGVDQLRIF